MNILSIGNSFSEDAQRYLSGIAAADGVDLYTVNLCIGGCPLESHARNAKTGDKAYTFQENGVITDRLISLKEGLELARWDVVTIQQVSTHSFVRDSYYPYVFEVAEFVRAHVPDAKLIIQETWAYEDGCDRLEEIRGDRSASSMHSELKAVYETVTKEISADGIIRSGDLMELMRQRGIGGLYRDTFHASWGYGRYAIGLLWYRSLTGADVTENSFRKFDESVSEEQISAAKAAVMEFEPILK